MQIHRKFQLIQNTHFYPGGVLVIQEAVDDKLCGKPRIKGGCIDAGDMLWGEVHSLLVSLGIQSVLGVYSSPGVRWDVDGPEDWVVEIDSIGDTT